MCARMNDILFYIKRMNHLVFLSVPLNFYLVISPFYSFILLTGGRLDANRSLAEVERYNPAVDAWEPVASLSAPRRAMAAAALNGRIYVAGGSGRFNSRKRLTTLKKC